MNEAQRRVAAGLREQAEWCRVLSSPLYVSLLRQAAEDVESGGPCWRVLESNEKEDDARGWALALAAGRGAASREVGLPWTSGPLAAVAGNRVPAVTRASPPV